MKPSEQIDVRMEELDKLEEYDDTHLAATHQINCRLQAVIEYLDRKWNEEHQRHTNNGLSCVECRKNGFVV